MWTNPQKAEDLLTFTKEIPNGKLHFVCSVTRQGYKIWTYAEPSFWLYWVDIRIGDNHYIRVPQSAKSLREIASQNWIYIKYPGDIVDLIWTSFRVLLHLSCVPKVGVGEGD